MDQNSSDIEFRCAPDNIFLEKIMESLPDWKTVILETEIIQTDQQQIRFFIAASTTDAIKSWLDQLQFKTKVSYSIRNTEKCKGKSVTFKQRLTCHHKTRSLKTFDPSHRHPTKNTNCQSRLVITLHSEAAYLCGKALPNSQFPCEIIFVMSHNHGTQTPADLKFRSVSQEMKKKLLDFFKRGHTVTTALEMLKTDIYLNFDDHKTVLCDKYYCPDYRFCSYLYNKEFRNKHSQLESKDFLANRVAEFNKAQGSNCAEILFSDEDYVISICPPLFKRAHSCVPSEVIYVESSDASNHSGNRVFIFLTPTECGGLPLGIIITSGSGTTLFCQGLQLLHEIVGDGIFGGSTQGPRICLSDGCVAEMSAIERVWANTKCFLSTFHVLKSFWKWLTSVKSNVPHDTQRPFYEAFKRIMYAENEEECRRYYLEAAIAAEDYPVYRKYLELYWERREMWALCFQRNLGVGERNCSETIMVLFKDKIFQKTRTFNVEQLVDFMLTTFVRYYEVQLLEIANNTTPNGLGKLIETLPSSLITNIRLENDYIVLVPGGPQENVLYVVNSEILICTCVKGNRDPLCKHIEWACSVVYSPQYSSKIGVDTRLLCYKIATGDDLCPELLIGDDFQTENQNFDNAHASTSNDPLTEGQATLEELFLQMNVFLEKSPQEVLPALKTLSWQLKQLGTTSDFVSACCSFGKDFDDDRDPLLKKLKVDEFDDSIDDEDVF